MKSIIKKFREIYWMLFCLLFPLAIGVIPIVPALILDNPNWLFGFIASFPIYMALADIFWDVNFITRY